MEQHIDLKNAKCLTLKEAKAHYGLNYLPYYCEDVYDQEVFIFEEDVHLAALEIDKALKPTQGIVFLKNLVIDNALIQEETDYGPLVVVIGNVTAKNIFVSGGTVHFRSNVNVEQSLVAGIYNHGETSIDGLIEASFIFSTDHFFNYKEEHIKRGFFLNDNSLHAFEDILKKEFLNDGSLNEKKIISALRSGQPLTSAREIKTPLQKRIDKFHRSKKKKLDLSYLELEEVPEEIWGIVGIEELNLSGNNLTCLPQVIARLEKLKIIDASYCDFTEFPEILFKINSLEELRIGKNDISALSDAIQQLKNLKRLSLYRCNFQTFPKIIYALNELVELDISCQQEQEALIIDECLPAIEILKLEANFHSQITVAQPTLKSLSIQNCALKMIPDSILTSENLESLNIIRNRGIASLPEKIIKLKKLKHFAFTLDYLPSKSIALLSQLPKLRTITIHIDGDNDPEQLADITKLPQWTHLHIEGEIQNPVMLKEIINRPNLKEISENDVVLDIAELRRTLDRLI